MFGELGAPQIAPIDSVGCWSVNGRHVFPWSKVSQSPPPAEQRTRWFGFAGETKMPEHRPETGGLLLPPVPYVWPFGIRFGPNDRQTGSCTLAANFVGIRRAFALSAFEYSATSLGPRRVGGFLEIRRLSTDCELTKPRSRVVFDSARWVSKYSIRFNAFPPMKRCFASKSFRRRAAVFLPLGIFMGLCLVLAR